MGDSAKMNIWLHKTVLARIAANGEMSPKSCSTNAIQIGLNCLAILR